MWKILRDEYSTLISARSKAFGKEFRELRKIQFIRVAALKRIDLHNAPLTAWPVNSALGMPTLHKVHTGHVEESGHCSFP
ncbi:hypothetical protein [Cupriavidus pauculus]|uniref:hypothetical protein n=1 Tax=Cupriavidus pauculus TaxID=82633 RepID=UPI001FD62422|nr:hypothetical protein [Cupriavidus pauculus]